MVAAAEALADWLDEAEEAQAAKAAYDEPSLTVRELDSKAKLIVKALQAFEKKPKPKAAPKKTPPKANDGQDGKKKGKHATSDGEPSDDADDHDADEDGAEDHTKEEL